MGPLTDYFAITPPPFQGPTKAEISDASKAIYLVGTITYDTVFGRGLTTNFRYYVGGDIGWEPGEMSADEEGNTAT
jgi:hypothetical protein